MNQEQQAHLDLVVDRGHQVLEDRLDNRDLAVPQGPRDRPVALDFRVNLAIVVALEMRVPQDHADLLASQA